jgi:oligopeptide/dipeptide ABC transporter ATP-binding protein
MTADSPALEVRDLVKHFTTRGAATPLGRTVVPAVDGVSFAVPRGATTAIVGESGSGKSTLARLLLHLHKPDRGEILLLGQPVAGLSSRQFRPHRRNIQMVFQNPLLSFDPLRTIAASVGESLRLRPGGAGDADATVLRLLDEVGLSGRFAGLRPGRMSGGELQRAAIARALAVRPALVVLDEPTSALDMSIRGQVLRLIRDLQDDHGISYLIATHDLRVVRMVAHEVIVLYLGQIVERAPARQLFDAPAHPYTQGLLGAEYAAPGTGSTAGSIRIKGALRYPDRSYQGCRLVGRCPLAGGPCREPQPLAQVAPGRWVRCWRAGGGQPRPASNGTGAD